MLKLSAIIHEETKSEDEISSQSSDITLSSGPSLSESNKGVIRISNDISELTVTNEVDGSEWAKLKETKVPTVAEVNEEPTKSEEIEVASCPENQLKTPLSFRSDFIPDEILQELTNASVKGARPFYIGPPKLTKTPKDLKIRGIRPADAVWHHTTRRTKLNFLIDQPVSFTSAGRKPNKKFEVIQLSKVMDSMFEKAGLNDPKLELHHLLELVKQEQNIYNIVFHELIRQITVDCAERGELLSKVRQRYVNLLDSIPRHVKCLHDEILMQRALDRYLVQELFLFKTAIEELSGELSEIREHDLKVTRETEAAQDELAKALFESRKNANLVEEFHVLYELQRRRLDKQIRSLTQERDWWCAAAYSLALKVIEDNRLQLARRLQVSEKSWSKLGEHFAIILSLKDTEDLGVIQKIIEHWRELMSKFTGKLEHFENSSMEKRKLVLSEIQKWHKYFSEKILCVFQGVLEGTLLTSHAGHGIKQFQFPAY
uniref:Axonemal dynein light chain domain-containing protein 1 n=1 Tax=Callorhinchus milii TaxID=7868 RepID=A0A4W3JPC8_CALMI